MAVAIYSTGTEYLANKITILRGTVADITGVAVYHTADADEIPAVDDFTTVTLADGTASPPDDLSVTGQIDVVSLVGANDSAEVTLAAGTYQRWILIQTATEDLIRRPDTITVL